MQSRNPGGLARKRAVSAYGLKARSRAVTIVLRPRRGWGIPRPSLVFGPVDGSQGSNSKRTWSCATTIIVASFVDGGIRSVPMAHM